MDAIFDQNEAFGLERTSASSAFVSLFDVFNKLSISFKLHGGLIWGFKLFASGVDTYFDDEAYEIPGYNYQEYHPVKNSNAYCGVEVDV